MKKLFILCAFVLSNIAHGHQFLPTYPRLEPSYVQGVLVTRMELFNSRTDVSYYEISVFDKDWKPVPFASESNILNIKYLQRKTIEIYIREQDRQRALYICSRSKHIEDKDKITIVSSRICSKIK